MGMAAPAGTHSPADRDFEPSRTVRIIAIVAAIMVPVSGMFGDPGFLVWILSFAVLWYARRRHREEQYALQTERNDRARRLLTSLTDAAAAGRPSFVLYLRPFASVGKLPVPLAAADSSYLKRFLFGDRFDLELFVSKALRDATPPWEILAIGDVADSIGAGKIVTDDAQWQGVFDQLAAHADAIVLAPFARPGTRWEIDRLLDDRALLAKTLFVMAPASLLAWRGLADLWNRMRDHLVGRVTGFPAYQRRGMAFRISPVDLKVQIIEDDRLSLTRFAAQIRAAATCRTLSRAEHPAGLDATELEAALQPLVAHGRDGEPLFPVVSSAALPAFGATANQLAALTKLGLIYEHDRSRVLGSTRRLFAGVMDSPIADAAVRRAIGGRATTTTDHVAVAAMKDFRTEAEVQAPGPLGRLLDAPVAAALALAVAIVVADTLARLMWIPTGSVGIELSATCCGIGAALGLGRWATAGDGLRGLVGSIGALLAGTALPAAGAIGFHRAWEAGDIMIETGLPLWPAPASLALGGVALAIAGGRLLTIRRAR